jgi:cellulose synthase/poly-beta-1,6-N-acetylglucosamine synthase-like glycosyltransferase
MMVWLFCVAIAVVYILIQLWQEWTILTYKHLKQPEPLIWPTISILIAARNEEDNIAQCLDSLLKLDYPMDKLNIICGNDQSSDRTGVILESYAAKHSHIRVVDIVDDQSGLKAKARVMAQIDAYATGEFYLITDADIQVKPSWAKQMILSLDENTGVGSGTTLVKGEGFGGKMQELDWAYFMGMLNVISYNGVPATAVGNNMIVRAEAYHQTGGYRNIRFSITEDYKLYSEICKRGWKWNNVMIEETTAYSAPVSGFKNLLHQRKRWLSGGRELPWYWWMLFGIFGLYYFIMPVLLWHHIGFSISILLTKWLIQSFQIKGIYKHLQEKQPGWHMLFVYEIYLTGITIATAIFSLLPTGTVWKQRRY